MSRAAPTLLLPAALVLLAACTSAASTPSTSPSKSPTSTSKGPTSHSSSTNASTWPTPDPHTTPGETTPGCTYPRSASQRVVTLTTKKTVAHRYGISGPPWPAGLEFDHRVPFALCGDNGPKNIWPELYDGSPVSAFVHNRKDQLEDAVSRLVHAHRLTLGQGQAVFLGDWRIGYCTYVGGAPCQGS